MADQTKPESDKRGVRGADQDVRGKATDEDELEDDEDLDEEDTEDEEGNF
jgi:hypothetical protein